MLAMGIIDDRERARKIRRIIAQYIDGDLSTREYLKRYCGDDDIWEEVDVLLKEMSQVKREVDDLSRYFITEDRLWDLSFLSPLPPLRVRSIIDSLPQREKCSLWLHSELKKDIIIPAGADHHKFFMERIERIRGGLSDRLLIIAHNNIILQIIGHKRFLDYIESILPECQGWTEHEILQGITLPSSLEEFESEVRGIIKRLQILGEKRDNLWTMIYQLYDLT